METVFMHNSKEACKMSNSVFQSVIIQLREVADRTFGVMDDVAYETENDRNSSKDSDLEI